MVTERARSAGRSSDALVADRRERMLQRVFELGQVSIPELATFFDVSVMTVHRDLDSLSEAGLLKKVRGGAVAPTGEELQTSAKFRLRAAQAVKRAVAAEAVRQIGEVRSVIVDDSTSVLPVLRALDHPELVVVTNFLAIAREMADSSATVHLIGGELLPELDATFGPQAVRATADWHVDLALMGNPALRDGVLYHPLLASVDVKRAMLDSAERRMLVIDHTKLGRTALHRWATAADFTDVVVDTQAPEPEVDSIERLNCRVHLATVAEADTRP